MVLNAVAFVQALPALHLQGWTASGGQTLSVCQSLVLCGRNQYPYVQTQMQALSPAWSSFWVPSPVPAQIWSWTLRGHSSGTPDWTPRNKQTRDIAVDSTATDSLLMQTGTTGTSDLLACLKRRICSVYSKQLLPVQANSTPDNAMLQTLLACIGCKEQQCRPALANHLDTHKVAAADRCKTHW